MKKTYQQPTVAKTEVKLEATMLGASKTIVFDDTQETGTGTGTLIDDQATSPGMARRHNNIWEDEEEEEF